MPEKTLKDKVEVAKGLAEGLERAKKSYMGWMHVPKYNTPEEK